MSRSARRRIREAYRERRRQRQEQTDYMQKMREARLQRASSAYELPLDLRLRLDALARKDQTNKDEESGLFSSYRGAFLAFGVGALLNAGDRSWFGPEKLLTFGLGMLAMHLIGGPTKPRP